VVINIIIKSHLKSTCNTYRKIGYSVFQCNAAIYRSFDIIFFQFKSAPRRLYEDEDEQPAAAASGDDEEDAPVILQQLPKPPTPLSLFQRRRDGNSEGPSSSRSSFPLRRPTPPSTPATCTTSIIDARQNKIQEGKTEIEPLLIIININKQSITLLVK